MAAPGGWGPGRGWMLLEAAEYLERRERGIGSPPLPTPPSGAARFPPPAPASHGYASLLPGGKDGEALRRRAKARKSGGGSRYLTAEHVVCSSHRRAHLRLCLEKLKGIVPLGPEASRHTTLSLLTKAKLHIKQLQDYERKAVHQIDKLQREQRHLKRQLEKLGIERIRMDSIGSTVSSERSDSDRGETLPSGGSGAGWQEVSPAML
uniref:MAX dimerization protein 1 n=2 Tax=Scolopacidae TaxID=8917 RepID=A0A8C3KD06_9CHAR